MTSLALPLARRRTALVGGAVAVAGLLLAPAAARAQSMPAAGPAVGAWTLGMDAGFLSRRYSADGQKGQSFSQVDVPRTDLRLGYQIARMAQLEFPVALTYLTSDGSSALQTDLGVDLNLTAPTTHSVRPLAGVGGRMMFLRFHDKGAGGPVYSTGSTAALRDVASTSASVAQRRDVGSDSRSATQFGYAARVGFEWQATTALSLRPALVYEHMNEKKDDELYGESLSFPTAPFGIRSNSFGFSLGATAAMSAVGSQAAMAPDAGRHAYFSFGADLGRQSYGKLDDGFGETFADPAVTHLQLPTPSVGAFVPLTADGRVALGSDLRFLRIGTHDGSVTFLELQPGVQFNLSPSFRTARGVRLGAHANYRHVNTRGGGDSFSFNQTGAGADLSLTMPMAASVLGRVGVGYDYLPKNDKNFVPSESTVSLKFGLDVF